MRVHVLFANEIMGENPHTRGDIGKFANVNAARIGEIEDALLETRVPRPIDMPQTRRR